MAERYCVHFTNIPSACDRKTLHKAFNEFGTITKLYLAPNNEFGKIFFDNIESQRNANEAVKNNSVLNLSLRYVNTSKQHSEIIESGSNHGLDKSASYARRSNSYSNNTQNDVGASVTREYVDVFGRVVTTLQDDDGDLYISLKELKKSGFELFQHGSLPPRNNSRVYNELKVAQFEVYMKMKAAKFMRNFNFDVPEHKVNSIIESELSDYFDLNEKVAASSTMKSPYFKNEFEDSINKGYQPQKNTVQVNATNDADVNKRYLPHKNTATNDTDNHIPSLLNMAIPQPNNGARKNVGSPGSKSFTESTSNSYSHANSESENDINNRSLRRPVFKKEVVCDVKPLERVGFALNENHQVLVVHVETDKVGWVQLSTNRKLIKNLLDDTTEECRNANSVKPVINGICGALFLDEWCRAMVLSTSPLKIQYIDYGNENTENLDNVCELSNKLRAIPAQAVRINLQGNPNVNLHMGMDLDICPTKQDEDGTYIVCVAEVSAPPKKLCEEKPPSPAVLTKTSLSNADTNKSTSATPPLRPLLHQNVQSKIDKPLEKSIVRKIVIEDVCETVIFEFGQTTGTRTFTGTALTESYANDLEILESITADSRDDPSFKPKVGDLVAAYYTDDYGRAVVLGVSNQQYVCGFMDYGVIKIVEKVRLLPDKYVLIPEFAFEGTANPEVIREIENAKSAQVEIKSPFLLTLTLESGKAYEIQGCRWDPLKSHSSDVTVEQSGSKTTANVLVKSDLRSTLQRKLVIEDVSENGVFEFVTLINDTTFIAFALPEAFEEGICVLEGIANDSHSDPLFTPVRGDLVAATGPDGFTRGIVLSKSSKGQYECALIDYGTTNLVTEVRMLPKKYIDVPEFSFECTADSKIVQDIKAHKCEKVKITSPCVLNLTLETGKQYEVKGHRWDPLKSACSNEIHSKTVEHSISNKTTNLMNKPDLKSTLRRKLVIEDVSENGVFEFVTLISDTTFIAFALPEAFEGEICVLEGITNDSHSDPSFAPVRGDLVAATGPDGFTRGIVLSKSSKGQYECALIDYGTINFVTEVRMLPKKYVDVPEFSFECTADSKIVQDIKAHKCENLKITSPCVLNLTLESGKQYEVKGHRWDPIKALDVNGKKEIPQQIVEQPKSDVKVNQPLSTILNLNLKSLPKSTLQRRLAIETVCEEGVFQFIENVNDTTFVGFTIPDLLAKEVDALDRITDDCQSDSSFKPQCGDLVAAKVDGNFVRGIVKSVSNGTYTCALIDFGVTNTTKEVRRLPDKYITIPEFAFEGTADRKIVQDLQHSPCKFMEIKSPCMLTVHLESGKEYEIKGYRWDPLKTDKAITIEKTKQESELPKQTIEKTKQAIFNCCPSEKSLKDKDQIIIIGAQNDSLFVRNKECNTLFKMICQELADFNGESFENPPQVGYLAVCNFNDDNWYRVIIKSINGAKATVEYIDFGADVSSVLLKDLKAINEKLASMDNTRIKINLKDFVGRNFNPEILKMLTNISEKKEKFVVLKLSEGVYDVVGKDEISLSEKFNNLTGTNSNTPIKHKEVKPAVPNIPAKLEKKPICTLSDLTRHNIDLGMNELLCLFAGYLHEGTLSFCKTDPETAELLNQVTEAIPKYVAMDNVPYKPELFEICLSKFEDDWCRAAILNCKDSDSYVVFYIDFGNSNEVTSRDIRKLPEELSKIRGLAVLCSIDGVIKGSDELVKEPLLSRLLQDISENQIYNVNVISKENNEFIISIPSLLEAWKKDRLL